jgi:LAGLIDADG endonuclease
MSSENPIGADNQQETISALDPRWVVGFVDGEGCFSVSIHHNELARRTRGWHVQPTFQVSQHTDHRDVLEELRAFFGCGNVRSKGPASSVDVFVSAQHHPARESGNPVLRKVRAPGQEERLRAFLLHREGDQVEAAPSTRGLRRDRPARLRDERERQATGTINRRDPDGILRDCTQGATICGEDTVRSPWRHGEPDRNDLATHRNVRSNKNA